jgi:MoaA/NifB/PqqE/SkfB family radical SAM enzyme
LIGGIAITDDCNLNCVHCWDKSRLKGHSPFGEVRRGLEILHSAGARLLYIQGGEPFSWSDGSRTLGDVVDTAREVGFFHIVVCTNGTYALETNPDSFSVSLEGRREAHERIRPGSFDRIMTNVEASSHPGIFVNTTFCRENVGELEPLASMVASSRSLRGLLINFHIPYPGVEHLALTPRERETIALKAVSLKRDGYPILNSFSGLRALARNDWKRPLDASIITDCDRLYSCCRARGQDSICRECGYAVWAELSRILDWDFIAAFENLRTLRAL